jgi:peptidoglycan/xylan/chitin deacetylase (PgdA/CDA1 family)
MGAHSIDHPRYADLPLADQLHQTRESLNFVKKQFALDYGVFSFPHSDALVSRAFYREASAPGGVEVFFGNQGLLEDCVPQSVQRTSMEKTALPAEAILGKSYARRCFKKVTGRLMIRRA